MMAVGLQLARAPRVLVISHGLTEALADVALLEKLSPEAMAARDIDVVALVDAGADAKNPLAPLVERAPAAARPHAALLLRAGCAGWPKTSMSRPEEIAALVGALSAARDRAQWCHLPAPARTADPGASPRRVHYARRPPVRRAQRAVRELYLSEPVRTPGISVLSPRRWAMNMAGRRRRRSRSSATPTRSPARA